MINKVVRAREELRAAIGKLPRVPLANLPTPLHEASSLSEALGGPRIYFKRDDLTGMAVSGNKARMFEFELAEAIKQGADTVVAGSVIQSNLLRVLAAACAKLGLEAHFLVSQVRGDRDIQLQGNLLLDLLLGANVRVVDVQIMDPKFKEMQDALVNDLEAKGHKVYVPYAEHIDLGVVGYANCALELTAQLEKLGIQASHIYLASSMVTQAGLLLGMEYLKADISIQGFVPEHWRRDTPSRIAGFANKAAERLGIDIRISSDKVNSTKAYIGEGYGIPTAECLEALKLVARMEGILLDPVYTGKAMAGLIDHIRKGKLGKDDTVIFLHTGGFPSLFAYNEDLNLEDNLIIQDDENYIKE